MGIWVFHYSLLHAPYFLLLTLLSSYYYCYTPVSDRGAEDGDLVLPAPVQNRLFIVDPLSHLPDHRLRTPENAGLL